MRLQSSPTKAKPKFKINIRKPASSPFHQLVREAIEVSEKLNTAYSGRLSGEACLREAMALAKCSPKQLAELRTALRDGRPGLDHSRGSVGRIKRELIYTRRLNSIPSDASQLISRLRYYCARASEELTGLNASILTLLCVAIAEAIDEKGADVFGSVDKSSDLKTNVAELQAQQRKLFEQIQASITADELDFGNYQNGRATPAKFKNTDVEVAPVGTAGERLIQYLMAHREKRP